MADKPDTAVCRTAFHIGTRFVPLGEELPTDHDLVKRYPTMFETTVRTTATVPGPVTSPPPVTGRPTNYAPKRDWEDYVTALGGAPGERTKAELMDYADELEG